MNVLLSVLLSACILQGVSAGFYNGFGYHGVPSPFYHNVIPAGFPAHPLFSYNVVAGHPAASLAAAPPPVGPMPQVAQSIYSAPSNTFRGFSYHTDFLDGGKSEVVFVTGPDASKLFQQSMSLFREIPQPGNTATAKTEDVTPSSTDSSGAGAITSPAPESTTAAGEVSSVTSSESPIPATSPLPFPAITSPLPSYSRVQVFHSNPYPYFASPFGVHNLFSTYYQHTVHGGMTPEELSKQAEEAQESMVSEIGAVIPPPQTTAQENGRTEGPSANEVGQSSKLSETTESSSAATTATTETSTISNDVATSSSSADTPAPASEQGGVTTTELGSVTESGSTENRVNSETEASASESMSTVESQSTGAQTQAPDNTTTDAPETTSS